MEQKREMIPAATAAEKWEGTVRAEMKSGVTKDEVWPLLADFFNAHKWLPHIQTCYPIPKDGDGEGGRPRPLQPGVIRYCGTSEDQQQDGVMVQWVTEKLTGIDPEKKWLSYEIVENSMGFKSYSATMKLIDGEDGSEKSGCVVIEWWFEADPIDGWRLEDLVSLIDGTVHAMAKRMEDAIQIAPAVPVENVHVDDHHLHHSNGSEQLAS